MTQPTSAGWYPDLQIPNTLRWWDGVQWTSNTHALPSPPTADTPTPATEPATNSIYTPPSVNTDAPPRLTEQAYVPPAGPVLEPPTPAKKQGVGKLVLTLGAVVVALLIIVGIVNGVGKDDKKTASATTTTTTLNADQRAAQTSAALAAAAAESSAAAARAAAESATRAAKLDKSAYQSVDSRTWQLVAKNPAAHVGEKYLVYGRVTQADTAMGTSTIRVNTDGAQVDYYDMDINTVASQGLASFSDVVEDDLVTMWVEVTGSTTYDTTIGGSVTAPTVDVNIIQTTGHTG